MIAIDDADRLLPPPCDLGLPDKFRTWRHFQDSAIYDIAQSDKRFVMAVLATGAGKSAMYMAIAALLHVRTCVLTQSKALMAQLQRDFTPMGLTAVSGMGSYRCLALEPQGELFKMFHDPVEAVQRGGRRKGCDEGPCRVGTECSLREGGCHYYDAVRHAIKEPLVNSNYDYWMFSGKYGRGLGDFGLLVLDEAHSAPEKLSDFLTVELRPEELKKASCEVPDGQPTWDQWRTWARGHHVRLARKLDELQGQMKLAKENQQRVSRSAFEEAHRYQSLLGRLELVQDVDAQWVAYRDDKTRIWTFTPAWPARYAEQALFRDVPKVLLTSATVRPKTAHYLGIPRSELQVLEYPSVFPKHRRPVYHIPVMGENGKPIRLSHRTSDADLLAWVAMIDNIIRLRLDRKGIIHTKSYPRARYILTHSQFAKHMVVHSSDGTKLAIERFRDAEPPCVLVSPSVATGYDFPYDDAQFQIIAKIPFLDSRDPVLQARKERDPEYDAYQTMQELVQMCGRIVRSEDDFGESFVLDSHIEWFLWKHRELAPTWFLDSVQRRLTIPPAPPKLPRHQAGR